MAKSKIEWTEKVWNPVTGCTKISPGCQNCYAERMSKRLQAMGQERYKDGFAVRCHPEALEEPLRWKKPSRIFVCSMADLFHDDVPFDFIEDVLNVMYSTSHTYLVLTKRPERMRKFFRRLEEWDITDGNGPNIWFGVTVENQEQADKRIPVLLQLPAAKRFVSIEPMLGAVDLFNKGYFPCIVKHDLGVDYHTGIDWVICGGESGPGARPMHPDWTRSLRDQCQAAGVPFFYKQNGEWVHVADSPTISVDDCQKYNTSQLAYFVEPYLRATFAKVGKKKAGRLLDGREWNEYPEVTK